jgi:hypothetical protein
VSALPIAPEQLTQLGEALARLLARRWLDHQARDAAAVDADRLSATPTVAAPPAATTRPAPDGVGQPKAAHTS